MRPASSRAVIVSWGKVAGEAVAVNERARSAGSAQALISSATLWNCRVTAEKFLPLLLALLLALRLHVVTEQHLLVAQVKFAVGNHRVRPGRLFATVGLVEAATLNILLRVRLNQKHGAGLGAII